MSLTCRRCGVGRRVGGGPCDWCAAPERARWPGWTLFRRRLTRSPLTAALRRRGAMASGVSVGVALHLLAAAVGVAFGLPLLWQAGFLGSLQWWWALVPEAVQPWLYTAASGAAYGALAGWMANRRDRAGNEAVVMALVGFAVSMAEVVFGWNPQVGIQYSVIAAALAAAVGGGTAWIVGGARGRR